MNRNELEKSLQQKKRCHAIYHFYFKHFACQYFIFRNENAKKTETAHRQKLSTYRETPCKATKTHTQQKKYISEGCQKKRITKSKIKTLSKLSKKNLLSVLWNRQKANNIYSMRQYLQCLYWPKGHEHVKLHKKNYCQKFYIVLITKHIMRTCEPCHITIRNIKNMLL